MVEQKQEERGEEQREEGYKPPKPDCPESCFYVPRPNPEQRIAYLDGKVFPQYIEESNKICNEKYTSKSFVPLVLYNQFKFFFNFFFLVIALSQFVPLLKVGFMFTYVAPLVMVLGLTMLKEFYDDRKRKQRDEETNHQTYSALRKSGAEELRAMDIKVGDIVEVKVNQRVPADMVLLYANNPEGSIYIRTDQLDGETDWKIRNAVTITQNYVRQNGSPSQLQGLHASITAEPPRLDIYSFRGVFKMEIGGGEGQKEGLSLQHTLWGNTYLASGTAFGIVIYTGREMKSVINTRQQRNKTGRVENELNLLSKALFLFMLALSVIITFSAGDSTNWLVELFRQVLLLSSIIPISLRVNLDFAKMVTAYRVNNDPDMRGAVTRNSQIPEQLGRVQYVLSDKTGTLTQNDMVFKKLSVPDVKTFEPRDINILRGMNKKNCERLAGPMSDVEAKVKHCEANQKRYRPFKRNRENVVRDLITALAVCNNVTPIYNGTMKEFQASSPDEIALVKTAEELNTHLLERTQSHFVLTNGAGQKERYRILAVFPFTSESKRMGIIVCHEETQRIIFYLKGADTVMKDRVPEVQRGFILDECDDMARQGYRTLVFTHKYLSAAAFKEFNLLLKEAEASITNRELLTRKALDTIQCEMELIGISGVEDKLQEEVADAITSLRSAGIFVWMITGDKVETACCIAISAGLKGNSEFFVIRDEEDPLKLRAKLDEFSCKLDYILVIDGVSITNALENQRDLFFEVACSAPAVICCRVSPTQKSQLTEGVKNHSGRVTLSVGDGGNDVGMIMTADVGVGIVGKEGKQAALASDFSILKFKHLPQLLLWHGRLSYKNTALMSQFVIHRGLIISVIQAIFSLVFYGVAIPIYNGWLMLGYTTLYTMFPVFCIIFDEDVSRTKAREFPELYRALQKGRELSLKTFLIWVWKSVYQGTVIMVLTFKFFKISFLEVVTVTFSALIVLQILNVVTVLSRVKLIHAVSQVLTLLVYFLSIYFLREVIDLSIMDADFLLWTASIVVAAWLPVHLGNLLRKRIWPEEYEKIMAETEQLRTRPDLELELVDKHQP